MSKHSEYMRLPGLASILLFFCWAAFADELLDELISCTAEGNDQRRLACYDREIVRLRPAADEQIAATLKNESADSPANVVHPEPLPRKDSTAVSVTAVASAPPLASNNSPGTSGMATIPVASSQADKTTRNEPASQPVQDPEPTGVSTQQEDADELFAVVTKVARQPRGEHVVYLDNGQVWAEQSRSSYFPVEPGDTISIKKRRLAGFRLLTESGKGFNVEQLR